MRQPGVYEISNEEYHSGEGISRTAIMLFRRSPLHYWNKYINPSASKDKASDNCILGDALHTFVLENDKYYSRYALVSKKTKKMKEENAGKILLSFENHEAIENMATALMLDFKFAKIENSIYWIDEETGMLCKCRPDILQTTSIIDLKTSKDASSHAFKRQVYQYGYHIQAAMAIDGLAACGIEIKKFEFIVVEKEPPYATAHYIISDEKIEEGRIAYKEALISIKSCMDKNEWPTHQPEII